MAKIKTLILTDNIILAEWMNSFVKQYTNISLFKFYHSVGSEKIFADSNMLISPLSLKDSIEYILGNYNLVISLHCKQFFPKKLVNNVRCINVHPGYNPYNRGWYPQVFSIINNGVIGATIHEIDQKLDHGGIICREKVMKYNYDTSETLYNRVIEKEKELINKYFELILLNSYTKTEPEEEGTLFTKSDFEKICEIDMDEVNTYKSFYDKIRALSHGDYYNAWYIDKETGEKIYFKLLIKVSAND